MSIIEDFDAIIKDAPLDGAGDRRIISEWLSRVRALKDCIETLVDENNELNARAYDLQQQIGQMED